MNSFCINIIQKNKLIFVILLLVFSVMSVYMPNGLAETHEHHDYESLFKYSINNNKPAANLKKLLKKIKALFLKVFKLSQVLSSIASLANRQLVLFSMLFSKMSILYLLTVLCLYFHGGKYKQSIKHSDLLPLLIV